MYLLIIMYFLNDQYYSNYNLNLFGVVIFNFFINIFHFLDMILIMQL